MNYAPPKLVGTGFKLELNGILLSVKFVARDDNVVASQSRDKGISVANDIQHIWGAWTALTGDTAAMQWNTQLIRDFTWSLLCGVTDNGTWHGKTRSESRVYQDFAAW